MFGGPQFEKKTDAILHFGKDLGWEIEKDEFFDIDNVGDYQTADEADVDAFPKPLRHFQIVLEQPMMNMEETYYWFVAFMRYDLGYPMLEKIYDIFNTTEGSQMINVQGQKLGAYQDKASQFLRGVGDMVRQLFQIVRELRVIDERIEPYNEWKTSKSADITLKHLYISLVEGGGQNPDSVYSLAQQVGFTVLPDLFFNTHVYDLKKIDQVVESGQVKEFNEVVKTVLRRKLYQYINWKEKSEKELHSRRNFQLKYLRQHWKTIQLYMSWIKPYIRQSRRMQQNHGRLDSADLIGAFDMTEVDLEVLAKKPFKANKGEKHFKCILLSMKMIRRPILPNDNQQFQGGWSGRSEINLRSYAWHQEDIDAYKKMRRAEDIEALSMLDDHIGGAFEALGEQFENYLYEAGDEEMIQKRKVEEEKEAEKDKEIKEIYSKKNKSSKYGPLEPFIEVGSGLGGLFKSFFETTPKQQIDKGDDKGSRKQETIDKIKKDKGLAAEIWTLYSIYKKSHRLLAW